MAERFTQRGGSMSIYSLKPAFQNLLRPIVQRLYDRGVTANQVTVLACLISVFVGVLLCCFSTHSALFLLLPLWLFLRMALNAIDGMLAREFHQQSQLGGYLNELTDVISDSFLYLPFALIVPFHFWQIGLFIWLALLTEMCGILGQVHGNSRRYDGPLGKSDRAFLIGALGLWYAIAGTFPPLFVWLMWGACIMLIVTCYKRVRNGLI